MRQIMGLNLEIGLKLKEDLKKNLLLNGLKD